MILRIKDLHPLTVSAQGGGGTDPYTGTHRYAPGVTVPLNAWDNVPWYFDHWSGDLDTTDRQTSIVMNGPKSVTAVFKEKYTLALTFQNEGFN